jgi:hypothetical protein
VKARPDAHPAMVADQIHTAQSITCEWLSRVGGPNGRVETS